MIQKIHLGKIVTVLILCSSFILQDALAKPKANKQKATPPINIAITIDDFPLPNGRLFTLKERTKRFIDACAPHNCKAVFFCVGQYCIDRKNPGLCKQLSENGHFLANHSTNHRGLSTISLDEFEKEITSTQDILAPYGMKKWFRYPYLDYGNQVSSGGSPEKSRGSFQSLEKLGYTEGYVTINTFDWHINRRLQDAIKQHKKIDYETLRTAYMDFLEEWIEFYIDLHKQAIDQEIVHTLLLHDNDLNALYLPDIIAMIKRKGWHIVSPERAFQDTSWTKELASKAELMKAKPASLNFKAIDAKLSELEIIK
jgi:peptidoglycan/xylan/chitin deacetylase (PgdA/CDA1 family)